MTEEIVDHQARSKAAMAVQQITAHEDRCGERWMEARKAADATNAAVSRIHTRIDKVLWICLAGVTGVIGQLLLNILGAK